MGEYIILSVNTSYLYAVYQCDFANAYNELTGNLYVYIFVHVSISCGSVGDAEKYLLMINAYFAVILLLQLETKKCTHLKEKEPLQNGRHSNIPSYSQT